jgi:hypothetical protein
MSWIDCLLAKLSLVKILLFENNHRNTCTLGGMFSFHTAGINTGLTEGDMPKRQ